MLYLKDPALIVVCISFTGTSSFASLFCYLFDFFMLTFYDFSAMSAEWLDSFVAHEKRVLITIRKS